MRNISRLTGIFLFSYLFYFYRIFFFLYLLYLAHSKKIFFSSILFLETSCNFSTVFREQNIPLYGTDVGQIAKNIVIHKIKSTICFLLNLFIFSTFTEVQASRLHNQLQAKIRVFGIPTCSIFRINRAHWYFAIYHLSGLYFYS